MKTPSRVVRLAGALLATVVAAPLAFTVAATADGYPAGETINPATLETAPATPLLHVVGRTIVDGQARIRVARANVTMVGRSGAEYLVLTSDRDYLDWRLLRVTREGATASVAGGPGPRPEAHLAEGGDHVVLSMPRRRGRVLRVLDAGTGDLVRRRAFGHVEVLDVGERRMVMSRWGDRATPAATFWWNPFSDRTSRIADHAAYIADITADRVGVFLGDPYAGACQRVTTLSTPRRLVWRSCDDAALSFSPSGKRMVTTYILSDGAGPRMVQVRASGGRLLDTYRAQWFGVVTWEDDRRLLLQAASRRTAAVVRCTLVRCERVSRLHRTRGQDPWTAMPTWTFAPESLLDR